MRTKRRNLIKGIGTVGGVGLAGCIGQSPDDSEPEDTEPETTEPEMTEPEDSEPEMDFWPPPRDLVEIHHAQNPGGLAHQLARLYLDVIVEHLPGDINYASVSRPEAEGILLYNDFHGNRQTYPADGSRLTSGRSNSMVVIQLGDSRAEIDIRDWRTLMRWSADTRAIQLNPRTMPVDNHFDITWEEFQEYAEDEGPIRTPYANAAQLVMLSVIREWDPVFNEENWQFVSVDGGGEARAAIQRGDLDTYQGSYVSNISTRNEFYYTQFALVDPNDQEFFEGVADVLPETVPEGDREDKTLRNNQYAMLPNVDDEFFPTDRALQATQIVADHWLCYLPPDTPDEVYDLWVEACEAGFADGDRIKDSVTEQFAEPDYNPLAGEAAHQIIVDKYATFAEDEEVSALMEEHLF